jgi:hypothetical protein
MCCLSSEGSLEFNRSHTSSVSDAMSQTILHDSGAHRMCHKARVYIFIGPGFDEPQLSATTFLRGCSKKANSARDAVFLQNSDSTQEGSNGTGSYKIVPTRMANARKRVIFGIESDNSSS